MQPDVHEPNDSSGGVKTKQCVRPGQQDASAYQEGCIILTLVVCLIRHRLCTRRNLLKTPVGVAFGGDAGQAAVLVEGRGDTVGVEMLGLGSGAGEAPAWAAADVLRGQAPLCLCSGTGAAGRVGTPVGLPCFQDMGGPYARKIVLLGLFSV